AGEPACKSRMAVERDSVVDTSIDAGLRQSCAYRISICHPYGVERAGGGDPVGGVRGANAPIQRLLITSRDLAARCEPLVECLKLHKQRRAPQRVQSVSP